MTEEKQIEVKKLKKMNPCIALILSLLCPGLGQVYTKRLNFGFFVFAAIFILTLLSIYSGLMWIFWGMVIFTISKFCLHGYAIVESFLYSRKADHEPGKALTVIGIGLLFLAVSGTAIYFSPYKAYKMPSNSMSPTIEIGDFFVANKAERLKANAKRRSIVAINDPQGSSRIYVKRIVAIAGDTVEIRNDSLYVNNTYVQESPEYFKQTSVPKDMRNIPQRIVQPNTIYVLGDNRNNSLDSRHYGNVPVNLIDGFPQYIYFGRSIKRFGIDLKATE